MLFVSFRLWKFSFTFVSGFKTMKDLKSIKTEQYNYDLPGHRIAKFPLEERHNSKLLILRDDKISEDVFINMPDYLPRESLLVFNQTRVIQSRLFFRKATGSIIEIFCLEPFSPYPDFQRAFQVKKKTIWKCFVGNSKRWKSGNLTLNAKAGNISFKLTVSRIRKQETASEIEFTWLPGHFTFGEVLDAAGSIPIPPYLKRKSVESDKQRYQTVFARNTGSVAAPTAGLHFTEQVFEKLSKSGIEGGKITLHVGAGTFKPVISDTIEEHEMHFEKVMVDKNLILNLHSYANKKIIPVGTTSVRTLESLYWFAVKQMKNGFRDNELHINQWEPYEMNDLKLTRTAVCDIILKWMKHKDKEILTGSTQLMIVPGYWYKMMDGMLTNFHQPKSTLLLLVAAFIGEKWKNVYDYALAKDFRMLSYGDSCLFLRE